MNYPRHFFSALLIASFGLGFWSVAIAQAGSARMLSTENSLGSELWFQQYEAPKTGDQTDGFSHHKEVIKSAAQIQEESILSTLRVVHDLRKENKAQQGLDKLRELDAIPNKTAHENFLIDRTRVALAASIGDEPLLLKSAEAVIGSNELQADEQLKFIEFMAITYYNNKDYTHSLTWINRYFKEGGTGQSMRKALVFSHFFNNDFAQAADEVSADILAAEQMGQKPTEEQLRLLIDSERKLKNQSAYISAMERYVSYYPKKEYWADLLSRVLSKPEFSERLTLDMYRLMMATDQVQTGKDYVEMSQVALQSGYALEASKIVDEGFQAGALGTGSEAAAHKQLRELTRKAAAQEVRAIDKDAVQIIRAKKGGDLVTLGFAYVERGMLDKGVGLMEQGVRLGGLDRPDETSLHLAIAYIKAGRKADAVHVLNTIHGKDGSADLARYWVAHLAASSTS